MTSMSNPPWYALGFAERPEKLLDIAYKHREKLSNVTLADGSRTEGDQFILDTCNAFAAAYDHIMHLEAQLKTYVEKEEASCDTKH